MVKRISSTFVIWMLFVSALFSGENPGSEAGARLKPFAPLRHAQATFHLTSLSEQRLPEQGMPNAVLAPVQKSASRNNRTAFLKSLVIPGWGQYALGAKSSARNFVISEIVLIGTSLGFNVYSNWLEDDLRALAARHAGVQNAESKDDQFWVDIGNFDSVVDFNDEKLRQRNTVDLRDVNGEDAWQWDNEANRTAFEDLRIRRDRAAERSAFMIAGIVANHVISAVHAIWLNKKAGSASAQNATGYRIVWENTPRNDGGRLKFSYAF